APEAFAGLRLQGIFAGGAVGFGGRLGCGLGRRRLSLGSGIVLCENWHSQDSGQQQSEDSAVFHFKLPPSEGMGDPLPGAFRRDFDCIGSRKTCLKLPKANSPCHGCLNKLASKSLAVSPACTYINSLRAKCPSHERGMQVLYFHRYCTLSFLAVLRA